MNNFYLNTYKEYTTSTLSLTLEEMESVYTQMTKDIAGDEVTGGMHGGRTEEVHSCRSQGAHPQPPQK